LQEEEWPILLWDYLRHSPPQSEIIRELPYEFSQYFKSNPFPLQDQYPYLGELIEYEYLEIMMRFAPEAEGKAVPGKLHLNPAHVLACYTWPVHYIRKDFCDPKKLPRGEYHLLLWRDPQSLEVKFMEVNALVASLIRALGAGARDSQDLLNSVAEQHGLALSQEFMAEGARLIQDMIDKKIIV
jgi:hypothetical protein